MLLLTLLSLLSAPPAESIPAGTQLSYRGRFVAEKGDAAASEKQFDVTYIDGRKTTVTSRPSTDVAFERKFNRTIGSLFSEVEVPGDEATPEQIQKAMVPFLMEMRSDYVYFLAWHSSKSEKSYDDWLELVDEVLWSFSHSVDPTPPAVSAGQ